MSINSQLSILNYQLSIEKGLVCSFGSSVVDNYAASQQFYFN